MTLSERIEKARALRQQGYNCSQCVALVFTDVTGLNDEIASRITSGFGTGVAGTGEICGTLTGASIVQGMTKYRIISDKPSVNRSIKEICTEFADINEGMIRCRDLKTKGKKPCMDLIEEVVTILHNRMA